MKPLQTSERVLTWFCGVPPHESTTKRERIQHIILTGLIITTHALSTLSSSVFIYMSVDLEQTLYSLYQCAANLQTLYQAIATVLLCHKLGKIIDILTQIYEENENDEYFHLLKQTNDKCEWLWKIFFRYILGGYCAANILNSISSVLNSHFTYGQFEAEHVYHPFKFVLPWNQSTLLGYFLEIGFGSATSNAYIVSNGSLLVLFISICWHHQTFYEIFQNEAKKLDQCDAHRNDAAHLCKMIRFHNSCKDWFLFSAEGYSTFILIVLVSNILYLACCVFELDLLAKHPDFQVQTVLTAIAIGLSNLFAYCYYGKIATDSYAKIADCLYDCNWHDLEPKHRKYIVIMMINAQRRIFYHGFGVAVLNLETFLKMVRTIMSYYMVFKTLATD